jgi:hypothetical protein
MEALAHSHGEAAAEAPPALYGLVAEFDSSEALIAATRRTREAGYRRLDAFTPFPVDEMVDVMEVRDFSIPLIMLVGAIVGAMFGFGLIYYGNVISYSFNIGGQPLYGWPTYVPITFECTVLICSFFGFIGMFVLNRLPQPYHPVFGVPGFEKASIDRFFLCIEARDPRFDAQETRRFLESLSPARVSEAPEWK